MSVFPALSSPVDALQQWCDDRLVPAGPSSLPVAVDFDPDGLTIEPCHSCAPSWWAELVVVDGRVQLREWHQPGCTDWGDVDPSATPAATPLAASDLVARGAGVAGLVVVDVTPWTQR